MLDGRSLLRMEYDSQGRKGLIVRFSSSASLASLLNHYGIGSGCSAVVGVLFRFRPIRYSLNFGGRCPAVGVIPNFLSCKVWIGRLGSLGCRTIRYFVRWILTLVDRGCSVSFSSACNSIFCEVLFGLIQPISKGLFGDPLTLDLVN